MSILVTGCAGFIGCKVSELLLEEGRTVIGVDNMNDAYDVRLKEWRLQQLEVYPDFCFQRLDITTRKAVYALFAAINQEPIAKNQPPITAVINLAARAGVRQSLKNPWSYYETNVTGTLNLLELCKEYGIKKFVLASTSSVYGEPSAAQPKEPYELSKLVKPFREDQPTDRPLSPYASSKKAAETLCYTYHRLYELDVTVLRYFTVYGPAGRPDMSIFRFIRWIAEEEPVLLYGDGTQERDFTFVEDVAQGTLAALKPMGFEIINLGSDHPVAVNTVLSHLEGILGKQAQIESHPTHPADVPATWAEISKARELLSWEPRMCLKNGLWKAVAWYKENRGWAKEIEVTRA